MKEKNKDEKKFRITRRGFMAGSAGAVAGFTIMKPSLAKGFEANSRIEIGFVGFGGRGGLIARLMTANHKGYKIVSAADYFDSVVQKAGEQFNVAKNRRFSRLNGYKKVIDSKVDAMFFETPPCFFPKHVAASVEAGYHTYFAKPVACDVAGTLSILESGKKATKNKQVFLIDFQIPTNEFNIETVKRCHDGQIGKIGMLNTIYCDEAFRDPPKTANIESRLRHLVWVNDLDLGGGYLVNSGIHGVDAGLWVAGGRPVSATGSSRQVAKHNGDSRDAYSITYQYKDGLMEISGKRKLYIAISGIGFKNSYGAHLQDFRDSKQNFRKNCFRYVISFNPKNGCDMNVKIRLSLDKKPNSKTYAPKKKG
jgi:predicted dehydrogenase